MGPTLVRVCLCPCVGPFTLAYPRENRLYFKFTWTVVTLSSFVQVNYVKTIDSYLIGCFLFVFATLAEYSIVLFLAARMKRYQQTKDYKNGNRRHEIETDPSKSSLLSNAEELANGVSPSPFSFNLYLNSTVNSSIDVWRTRQKERKNYPNKDQFLTNEPQTV